MALESRLDLTPPEWTLSNLSGKLNPFCHIILVTTVLDDGVPIAQKNHRAQLAIRPDGSWDLMPMPMNPTTQLPFAIPAELMVRARTMIAGAIELHGLIDHILPDGSLVSDERDDIGRFVRRVTPVAA